MEPSEKTEFGQGNGTKAQIYVYDIETYPNCFLAIFKTLTETKEGAWSNKERHIFCLDGDLMV